MVAFGVNVGVSGNKGAFMLHPDDDFVDRRRLVGVTFSLPSQTCFCLWLTLLLTMRKEGLECSLITRRCMGKPSRSGA